MKYETPSGYTYYEVIGSSGTYTVTLGLNNSPTRNFCSCPAYSYAVLIAKTHIMVCVYTPIRLSFILLPVQTRSRRKARVASLRFQ